MKEGSIAEKGSYQELVDSQGAFAEYLSLYMNEQNGIKIDATKADDSISISSSIASRTREKSLNVPIARSFARTISMCSDTVYGSSPNSFRIGMSRSYEPNSLLAEQFQNRRESISTIGDDAQKVAPERRLSTCKINPYFIHDVFYCNNIRISVILQMQMIITLMDKRTTTKKVA